MYDELAELYDLFIDWPSRLRTEIPLLQKLGVGLSGQKIVDTACGTGHHARAWASEGCHVTAFDAGEEMVIQAQILDPDGTVSWQQGAYTEIPSNLAADALVCLGTSLPHVDSRTGYLDALRSFHAALRPGGKIVLHSRNLHATLIGEQRFLKPLARKQGDKTVLFWRIYDMLPPDHVDFNLAILRESDSTWDHRVLTSQLCVISGTELAEMAQVAGLINVQLSGHLDGRDFDEMQSPDVVLTAVRER
jgi:SAM-dependent methyltransferase